jgi:hypothetical protein
MDAADHALGGAGRRAGRSLLSMCYCSYALLLHVLDRNTDQKQHDARKQIMAASFTGQRDANGMPAVRSRRVGQEETETWSRSCVRLIYL